jgi:predicted signal transduction protein with EAL and GGDEF domain
MARSLELKTVAEGVESGEQAQFLREHDCDEIQGYFFSRPLPYAQLVEKLQSHAQEQADQPVEEDAGRRRSSSGRSRETAIRSDPRVPLPPG